MAVVERNEPTVSIPNDATVSDEDGGVSIGRCRIPTATASRMIGRKRADSIG